MKLVEKNGQRANVGANNHSPANGNSEVKENSTDIVIF